MACCFDLPSTSRGPRITELETTTSTCTAEAVTRRHLFVIKGYSSLLNHVGATRFVRSNPFEAGGFDWAVRYYPSGDSSAKPGFVSAYFELLTRGRAEAKASCTLGLVPWSGCAQRPASWHTGTVLFRDADHGYLAMLLDPKEGAPFTDVMFQVGPDSTFRAHRLVLWMRYRKLLDRTKDSRLVFVPESEVNPAVFSILLDFIYKESLPAMDDIDGGQKREMLKRLLVAAKLYGVDNLKRVCERILAG
ncbi:hypothetical protein QOZ80_8AG0622660 [Eleusine coracana subsp. coracana]|nr:hypothetical protein QOZ80_8AG0622660 [Eleusine coracana subsp. coracana]